MPTCFFTGTLPCFRESVGLRCQFSSGLCGASAGTSGGDRAWPGRETCRGQRSPRANKNTSKRTRLGGPAGATCLCAHQRRGGRGGRCRGIGRLRAYGNVSASQTAASLVCVFHVTNRLPLGLPLGYFFVDILGNPGKTGGAPLRFSLLCWRVREHGLVW